MSRLLARSLIWVLGYVSNQRPYSGLYLASAFPSAAGHLGFVRARPGLADLKPLLTPEAFLFDATHALGAAALRIGPISNAYRDDVAKRISEDEAKGDMYGVEIRRLVMDLIDLEDGRFEDALEAYSGLAAKDHGSDAARLSAASVCYQLGRVDEGDRWLEELEDIPKKANPCGDGLFQLALVASTLGGASGAVGDSEALAKLPCGQSSLKLRHCSEGRLASPAFQTINNKLWESVLDGDMSVVKKILVTRMLKRVVKTEHKDAVALFRVLNKATHSSQRYAGVNSLFALQASQALLSAVVLRAQPLSGERVRAALRVAEVDLARAMEQGDAPAAVSDLRLLVAFLNARDGRFDEALVRYAEVARDDPSDARPHYLAFVLNLFLGRADECSKWYASYDRLDKGSLDNRAELITLSDELAVAQALGGSPFAFLETENAHCFVRATLRAAANRVDAALVSALRDKNMSLVKRLEVRAVRAFLHAEVWSALKELKTRDGGSGTASN
ncbi:hypothetical protein QOZ80_1AG0019090 [Eleusine coracana subsp. coracana]|nr:hypothetical protein QOZ80_1AG0019090 [Eleusine coracana subsp. coracana]